jgi:hypothetical protein
MVIFKIFGEDGVGVRLSQLQKRIHPRESAGLVEPNRGGGGQLLQLLLNPQFFDVFVKTSIIILNLVFEFGPRDVA